MKFMADAMLGKLAKWLRILGYDTFYQRDIEDDALIGIAEREGRFVLTRDTRLVGRLPAGGYLFIRDNAPSDQLRQAVDELGLGMEEGGLLSRCTLCNVTLERTDRESVQGLVPEYTYTRAGTFHRCPLCGRVYWTGTHRGRIVDRLRKIKEKGPTG